MQLLNIPDVSYSLQLELKELEEKFRKAMIQNAQLDNEKSAISYQVELYKDKYQDLEAAYAVLQVCN